MSCILHLPYYIFNIRQGNSNKSGHKNDPTNVGRGIKYVLYLYYHLPLPTLVGCIFVLKIITVALANTKYMIWRIFNMAMNDAEDT